MCDLSRLASLAIITSIWMLVIVNGLFFSPEVATADIISPTPTPRMGQEPPGIPDSLLIELDSPAVEKLKDPVRSFLSDRNVETFKQKYAAIHEETGGLPAAEVFIGKLFAAYNQQMEALAVLEQYTNQSPDDPEAYITMGKVALRNGRVIDAWLQLQYARRLINQDRLPEDRKQYVLPVLIELQATTAERRNYWEEAEKLFLRLAEMKPELNYPLWRAGRIRVMAGQIESGFELLEKAHQQHSELPPPSLSIAQTLHDTSDWLSDSDSSEQVESWYKRAAEESPENVVVWANYFKWLILSNRPLDVVELHNRLTQPITGDREVMLMRGLAARYLDDLELAEKVFSAAHQANPQDIEVADQLALVLIESSDEAKRGRAMQLAERNLRQLPQAEVTLATAAWIQLKLGDVEVADRILGQLAARGNLSPQTAFYISELMEKAGQAEESRQLLKMAVESPGIFPQRDQAKKRLEG